jgi:hypothetical protein
MTGGDDKVIVALVFGERMISVFAATVATAALIVSGVGAQSQCNTVRNSQKQDCHLFSQSTCQAAGCCWVPVQPNPTNLPWCFRQATPFVFRPAYPGTRRPFEAALDLLRTNMLANVDIAGKGGVLASPDTNVYQGGSVIFFLKKTIPYCRAKTNFVV